jgi:hypothetical protein
VINKPTTRDEARRNAILAAEKAMESAIHGVPPAPSWIALAQAWADIAALMPEGDNAPADSHEECRKTRGSYHPWDDGGYYWEPEDDLLQESDYDPDMKYAALSRADWEAIQELRSGQRVTVHPDFVKEATAAIAFKNNADREAVTPTIKAEPSPVTPSGVKSYTIAPGNVMYTEPIDVLRAMIAARVVWSDDKQLVMEMTDYLRYKKEALNITIKPGAVVVEPA